jgi:PAS domain-containing protein
MIFTYDMDGQFQSINRKSEEVSGYTREGSRRTVWASSPNSTKLPRSTLNDPP